MNIRALAGSYLHNIYGWCTNRKIIVFESDDWGSIRMPSKNVYDRLKSAGIDVDSNPFNRFDNLESEEDVEKVFKLLSKYRDKNGNHPIITANFVVSNPDFNKIRLSKFNEYFYEPFTVTYERYHSSKNILELIKDGINNRLFFPQYHSREHLHALKWLKLLQSNNKEILLAFDNETFCIDLKDSRVIRKNLMATYDYENKTELDFILQSIDEGIKIFYNIFGFLPGSFIAPANIWDEEIERKFFQYNFKYIQSYIFQQLPKIKEYKKVYRKMGQKNSFNQYYLTRNCYFEPSTLKNYDWLKNCILKIKTAFLFKKPAIISIHRLNFIGSLSRENRENNLALFDQLLKNIIKEFPEVEFLHSAQLGELIKVSK